MTQSISRNAVIDLLKAVAMQVIVLHHFVSYGPLAEAAREAFPAIADWLYDHGRVAVQIFLVIGGYLAARTLSPRGDALQGSLGRVVVKRYLRLVPPYAVALLLAIACAALAREHIDDTQFISASPSVGQIVAHLLLLHDVLGFDALSAGVWYVAIDFQLFVLFALLLRGAAVLRLPHAAPLVVVVFGVVSLLYFNLDKAWDAWAVYFFGAYAMGALAWWAGAAVRGARAWSLCLALIALAALSLDFRWRPLVALSTMAVLHLASRVEIGVLPRIVSFLSRTSYAVFLMHFPVFMLVSALAVQAARVDASLAIAAMFAAWALSIGAGYLLHRYVESPHRRLAPRALSAEPN